MSGQAAAGTRADDAAQPGADSETPGARAARPGAVGPAVGAGPRRVVGPGPRSPLPAHALNL